MKKRLVSLLLALALLVLPVLPAFAAEEDSYTYVALGDSITTGVGLKDTHFSSTAKSYDVQENYHDYSKDCYVARVADALGLDRDHAVNYGMPAAMSSNILDLVRTGSTASGVAYYDLPTLRQELADADLITLLIGSNDTVLQHMGAMGRATNGKATKLLIPLLTGTMRELNLQTLQTLTGHVRIQMAHAAGVQLNGLHALRRHGPGIAAPCRDHAGRKRLRPGRTARQPGRGAGLYLIQFLAGPGFPSPHGADPVAVGGAGRWRARL